MTIVNSNSPQVTQNQIIITRKRVQELLYEFLKDFKPSDLRKFGNFKEIPEMLVSESEYPGGYPKANF